MQSILATLTRKHDGLGGFPVAATACSSQPLSLVCNLLVRANKAPLELIGGSKGQHPLHRHGYKLSKAVDEGSSCIDVTIFASFACCCVSHTYLCSE